MEDKEGEMENSESVKTGAEDIEEEDSMVFRVVKTVFMVLAPTVMVSKPPIIT